MVVKKTVKKAPVKKVITKKVPVKNVITKPTVTVETKRISKSDPCCTLGFSSCFSFKNFFIAILLIANTVLLSIILVNQTSIEELRTWGKENYNLLKQVFQTDWYKMQQRQQLEQALEMLSQPQQMPSMEDMQQYIEQEQPE